MKYRFKKCLACLLGALMLFSLTGCAGNLDKKYQNYIKSLIAINYLGASDDYIKATGANKEDAEALYQANVELMADNILAYYGVVITDAPEMRDGYVELAKNIYSKVNYSVSKAYKQDDSYYVDVTIHPINLFVQTKDSVGNYISKFNTSVLNGNYNDHTLAEYETEFSTGLLELLNDGCLNMTYGDPVVVTVKIIETESTYYISDEDFLAIDAAMIATDTYSATESDAQ